MHRHLTRIALAFSLLVSGFALAEDKSMCACGKPMEKCDGASCSCAQKDAGACPLHRQGHAMKGAMPAFDAKTVGTFAGTVTAIDRVEHKKGMVGVHLRLQAGSEMLVVHVGPASFVDAKMTFAPNDTVEVTGSKISFNGEPTVLANTVTLRGQALELRKADGRPLFMAPR